MVRNLAAQAEAILPQEEPIFARHPPRGVVLDIGCGTGEIIVRLASKYADATFIGIDLEEAHLACRHLIQAVPDPARVPVWTAQVNE